MGFLKRFFSISSKKSKKQSAVDARAKHLSSGLKPSQVEDTEAAVGRLLRSSSGRYAAEPQDPLTSLPPIPHPIDTVIPRPKSSSATIASVSGRSTYSVTIHSRTVHSRTEFPNAYPPMDVSFTPRRSFTDATRRRSKSVPITPRDKSRLLLLRQDPSVASLLNHYDDEGHLNSALFSNTPSPLKEGRVQRRRTGSTLRQLLGHASGNNSMEGDISWAEKFLGETDGNSSVSSIGPQTPVDAHFPHTLSVGDETALSAECDTSSTNQQTFSSLEVELSTSADFVQSQEPDSPHGNCTTPQRASQIFDFLGDKKRAYDGPVPVSKLPQLKAATPNYRRFSAESSNSDTKQTHISLRRSVTCIPQPTSPTCQRHVSPSSGTSRSSPYPTTASAVSLAPQPEGEESPADVSHHSSHGPRGPRSPSRIPSRSTRPLPVPFDIEDRSPVIECIRPTLGEKSNTDGNAAPARPLEMHSQIPKLRSTSAESKHSSTAIHSPHQHPICLQPGVRMKSKSTEVGLPTGIGSQGKENEALSRLPQPVTPIRLFGLHSSHLREQPSPTSSSELSPVAKQMMANVRQQRMQARQRERQAGRLGSSHSRIRY